MSDLHLTVEDLSGVGAARRAAADLARTARMRDEEVGRVALVVTEAVTNMVKHGGGGECYLRTIEGETASGVDLLAIDRGPGIGAVGAAMRDGFSSAGTAGIGLGAIVRGAAVFDLYSRPGVGTALFARVWAEPPPRRAAIALGALNVPYPGETVSGDKWAVADRDNRYVVMIADGLGHGPVAHDAARAAADTFTAHAAEPVATVLKYIHEALRPTRGAAVALAEIDRERRVLRFAGLGNIAGTILAGGSSRSMVSHYGTVGHDVRRIHEFTYPWPPDATLILHSDGLTARWTLDAYPGLLERHPMLIAGLLHREFRRDRDDATVVVLREAA